jgi:hypothetical protein
MVKRREKKNPYLISDVRVDIHIKEVTPTNSKGATVS